MIKDVDDHLENSHKGKCFYSFHDAGKENFFSLKYFAEEGLENGTDWIPIRFESSCGGIFFTTGKVVKDSFCLGTCPYMFLWILNFLSGVVFFERNVIFFFSQFTFPNFYLDYFSHFFFFEKITIIYAFNNLFWLLNEIQ